MILSTEIKYKNKKGEDIVISIDNLSKGSNKKIIAKCDYCDNIKEISFKIYNKNIEGNDKFSCCQKCGVLKSKENNLIKYGVETIFQTESFKEKSKKTLLNKYGVEHVSHIKEISDKKKKIKLSEEQKEQISRSHNNKSQEEKNTSIEKRILTNQIKYSVDNISQLQEIKDKKEKTFKEKYDGFTFSSIVLNDKVKNTMFNKYGFYNAMQITEIKEKIKNTNIEKYGVEYASQNDIIKEKIKNTILQKYGVDNIMFSEDFRKHNMIIGSDKNYIKYLGGRINLFKCDCGEEHFFEIDTDNYFKRKNRNNKLCTKCYPINENVSIKEKELCNFIKKIYLGRIVENYRDGLEIDIYLPELNIGFEFNGLYWHSDLFSKKERHLEKLNYFKNKGIRIYYVWEDDWDFKQEIIKSQIYNWLKLNNNKIWARKCKINEITDVNIVRKFLNNNHIQGFIHSSKKIGLYYNNELVSLMTFDKFEGRKKLNDNEWNISRFCSKLNYNISGAFSKILSYFINTYKPVRIITYADKEWSDGNLYIVNDFNLINESKISYKYLVNNKRIHKQNFKKSKLLKSNKDMINMNEQEITKSMNIPRIYDCGQLKFEKLII